MVNNMKKYAYWVESYEGNNNRKHYRNFSSEILDEKDGMYLVENFKHDKIWINKSGVKFVRYETDKA